MKLNALSIKFDNLGKKGKEKVFYTRNVALCLSKVMTLIVFMKWSELRVLSRS